MISSVLKVSLRPWDFVVRAFNVRSRSLGLFLPDAQVQSLGKVRHRTDALPGRQLGSAQTVRRTRLGGCARTLQAAAVEN